MAASDAELLLGVERTSETIGSSGVPLSQTKYEFKELKYGQFIGTTKDTYRVLSGIAVGRCCEVYEGESRTTGRPVALKAFRRHQKYQGALERELWFLKILSKPSAPVVQHYESVCTQGVDVLIQELLSGTLHQVISLYENTPISSWLISKAAFDIVRCLAYFHSCGIVHADLKPTNIMWCADTCQFIIIDFGISFLKSEQYSHVIQSRGYQAPEAAEWNRLERPFSKASAPISRPSEAVDLWSLGCIIAEMLTSERVNSWSSFLSVFDRGSSIKDEYSEEFLTTVLSWVERCLKSNPIERVTADDLLLDPTLRCHQQCMPSERDLALLPSRCLRFRGLLSRPVRRSRQEAQKFIKALITDCENCGRVEAHKEDHQTGTVYVLFCEAIHAETYFRLMNRVSFYHLKIDMTFYPVDLFQSDTLL